MEAVNDANPGDRLYIALSNKQAVDEAASKCGKPDRCPSTTKKLLGAADLAATLLPAGLGRLAARLVVARFGALFAKSGAIVAADGTRIVGFTGHGINRVIGDGAKRAGVAPRALLDAVKHPVKVVEGTDRLGRPFKVYVGTRARVVVNPKSGRVVSANPLSRRAAR